MKSKYLFQSKRTLIVLFVLNCLFISCVIAQSGKITSPVEGRKVNQSFTVKGTAEIAEDQYLWVLVSIEKFADLGQWYPQGRAKVRNGEWSLGVNFGNENDAGEYFSVIIISVEVLDHTKLNAYIVEAMENEKWRPIDLQKYLTNFTLLDSKEVIR